MGLLPFALRAFRVSRVRAPRPSGAPVRSTVGHSASLRAAGLHVRHLVPRPSMTDWMMARAVSLRGF